MPAARCRQHFPQIARVATIVTMLAPRRRDLPARLPRLRAIRVLLVVLEGFVQVACGLPAPARSFETKELLLTVSDLPPGRAWQSSGVYNEPVLDYCTGDCWEIDFSIQLPGSTSATRVMGQQVWRGITLAQSQGTYERLAGQTWFKSPAEWTYQSHSADQSSFGCYDDTHGASGAELCRWQGTYEEYLVILFAVHPYVTLAEIEQTVRAIDQHVSGKLGK